MRSVVLKALLGCGMAAGLCGPSTAQEMPRASAYESVMQWPDWSGVWSPGVGAGSRTTATPPKLTPEAQAIVDAFEAGKARGENLQTQGANCVPNGMPGIMRLPYPIEFTYSPGRVNILIETFSEIRRIYVDGRPLPEDPDPFFNGHSVGRWEGDTLVVHTKYLEPNMHYIDSGIPISDQFEIIERITMEDDGTMLRIDYTMTDPVMWKGEWKSTKRFVRQDYSDIPESECLPNLNENLPSTAAGQRAIDERAAE